MDCNNCGQFDAARKRAEPGPTSRKLLSIEEDDEDDYADDDRKRALWAKPTAPPTPPPTPQPPSQCEANSVRKQCEDSSPYAIFSEYEDGEPRADGECSDDEPCRVQCGALDCYVSAVVEELHNPDCERVIKYYATGADCGMLDALSLPAVSLFEDSEWSTSSSDDPWSGSGAWSDSSSDKCELKPHALHCGHLAPLGARYYKPTAGLPADKHKCRVKADQCSKRVARVSVPLDDEHRGVGVVVPKHYDVELASVNLVKHGAEHCEHVCALELPVPVCTTEDADSSESGSESSDDVWHRKHGKSTEDSERSHSKKKHKHKHTVDKCDAPEGDECADASTRYAQKSQAQRTINAAERASSALERCAPQAATSAAPLVIEFPEGDSCCDVEVCATQLAEPTPSSNDAAPESQADFATRAIELIVGAKWVAAQGGYVTARQHACCAQIALESLLAQYPAQCDDEVRCAGERIGVKIGWGDWHKKRALDADEQDGDEGVVLAAFEQCGGGALSAHDRDTNDAVVALAASIDIVDDHWRSLELIAVPLAIGTARDDFALSVDFADLGLPAGTTVRVSHLGVDTPSALCFTVDSPHTATDRCPSAQRATLLRSLRAALPAHPGAGTPFVNTLPSEPHASAAHLARLVATLPPHTHVESAQAVARQVSLHVTLRTRGAANCAVGTNTAHDDGYGVLVPAYWQWPVEGVPAYLPLEAVGQCIAGDRGGERCKRASQCANGYCSSGRCVDGVNDGAACSEGESECPYGDCYTSHGAYPALAAWRACYDAGCYEAAHDASACGEQDCAAARKWFDRSAPATEVYAAE